MSEACKHRYPVEKKADSAYSHFTFFWCPECGAVREGKRGSEWHVPRPERDKLAAVAPLDGSPVASEVEQVFEVLLESGISRGTVRAMRLAYRASDAMGMKRAKIVTGVSLMAVAPALTGLAAAFSTLWSVLSFGLWGAVFFLVGAVLLVSGAKS